MKTLSSSSSKLVRFCGNQKISISVADILIDGEEDDAGDGNRMTKKSFEWSATPRRILSRWFCSLKRSKEPSCDSQRKLMSSRFEEERLSNDWESKKRTKVEESVGQDDRSLFLVCSTDGPKGESPSSLSVQTGGATEIGDTSGRHMSDGSFNLGLCFGLAFLLAAAKDEFSKMVELRTEMEAFRKDIKDEIRRKDVVMEMFMKDVKDKMQKKDACLKSCQTDDTPVYSSGNSQENASINTHLVSHNQISSQYVIDKEASEYCDENSKHDAPRKEEFSLGMDQLAVELEAELEHLQNNLDIEDSSEHPQQQRIEMVVEDAVSTENASANLDEVKISEDAAEDMDCGVSPIELERRLHELLEAQQQERITELEFALERAKRKIREKNMEVSWWKNTKRLITRRVPYAISSSRLE